MKSGLPWSIWCNKLVVFAVEDCEAGDCEELPSQRMTKNEQLVGYTLYYYAYSTWEGRVLYMEDVFVRKEYRSRWCITVFVSRTLASCTRPIRSHGVLVLAPRLYMCHCEMPVWFIYTNKYTRWKPENAWGCNYPFWLSHIISRLSQSGTCIWLSCNIVVVPKY